MSLTTLKQNKREQEVKVTLIRKEAMEKAILKEYKTRLQQTVGFPPMTHTLLGNILYLGLGKYLTKS